MGLARDQVELEGRIRERTGVDPFSPIERGGLLATPEFASLLARIGPTEPALVARLCTLPPETPGIARPTERVVREMIDRASTEIILLGYELTDRDLVILLATAASRGANVIMICDRGAAARVLEAWPTGTRPPTIFHDRDRVDGAAYASMHAKCLLVDSSDLLVTSANFTFHDLHGNIQIGVRLSGGPAAEARKIFSHLVDSRVREDASC